MGLQSAGFGLEVAETAKVLENVFRCVNIALVNELKPVLAAMGIGPVRMLPAHRAGELPAVGANMITTGAWPLASLRCLVLRHTW